MTRMANILERKARDVVCIGPGATVRDAAVRMNDHQIGALVVTEAGRVQGIFTERDLLRRVVGEGLDPARTRVGEVMTREVLCCRADTDLDEARGLLMHRRVRHLPVLDDHDQLMGMISIGDLNAWLLQNQELAIANLHDYIYGRV